MFIQDARAESVNGKNRRFIKLNHGIMNQIRSNPVILPALNQIGQQLVFAGSCRKCFFGLQQFAPNPIPELFGRRFSKRHHQDLINTELFFQDQPQEQSLNCISFAGTGTGLNQIDAF